MLLAETLASCAAWQTIDRKVTEAVGIEINANHVRLARDGWVMGRVAPIHLGHATKGRKPLVGAALGGMIEPCELA